MVEGWRRSGQSMRAYAKQRGVDPQKLSYWRRALDRTTARAAEVEAPSGAFVPVRVVGVAEAEVEIVLGDVRVMVREGASRALIGEVVAALRRAC
jgi:transposase-like protein